MSAFFGYINKSYAILASDTLCSFKPEAQGTELIPRSYTCKTFLLPQYKSAFAITGTLQMGLCFFNNTIEFTYGADIDSLVGIDLSHFRLKLESDYDEFHTGTIYLIGYSLFRKTFKGFKLTVDPSTKFKWWEMPIENFIIKPEIENWEQKLPKSETQIDSHKIITDTMKLQKEEDKLKPLKEQVGIGGEIVYTLLEIDNNSGIVSITTQIIYQFDDYINMLDKMGSGG